MTMIPPRVTRPLDTKVRAPRLEVSGGSLMVATKTIGTNLTFKLTTENVSRSGMLLSWENKVRIPFIENTLIEMMIDPDAKVLDEPVACLGKIIRKLDGHADNGALRLSFGVQIVQMDNTDLEQWEACLAALAAKGTEIAARSSDAAS